MASVNVDEIPETNNADPPSDSQQSGHSDLVLQPNGESSTSKFFIESFFSNFFQEKNIKWLLLVGSAIVFGSSLMLVTRQWSEWPSEIKFLTVLSYTTAVYLFSELCRRRLQLFTTAKVMQGLTLFLLPICFLSHRWLAEIHSTAITSWAVGVPLLVASAAITIYVSRKIFNEWLHRSSLSFQASYVALCFAGAMPPTDTAIASLSMSSVLWLVLTVGVVKVNRHVFWLTEEHRMPRIFGFFPILLLGLQFVTLLCTKTLRGLPLEWLGLGLVLVATTVLLTARTVANVFRQRTGDLVFPWPLSIVVPMFVGIALVFVGVCFAFHGFSFVGPTTYAAVPTAMLAACLMLTAAKDTKISWFVWLGLILMTIAYQCVPTLASDLVQQFKLAAAKSVQEDRLPIAFYGLTYLPLIAFGVFAYRLLKRRSDTLFSQPIKQYTTFLALVLLAVSFGHVKALLMISAVNVGLFLILGCVFADRRYSSVAVLASILLAVVLVPAMHSFGFGEIPYEAIAVCMTALSVVFAGHSILDRWIERIPLRPHHERTWGHLGLGTPTRVCQMTGMALAVGTTSWWIASSIVQLPWSMTAWDIILCGLLCAFWSIQTVRHRRYDLGIAFWFVVVVGLLITVGSWVADGTLEFSQALDYGLVAMGAVCLATRALLGVGTLVSHGDVLRSKRHQLLIADASRITSTTWIDAFGVPLCDLTAVISYLGIALLVAPQLVLANLGGYAISSPWSCVAAVGWLGAMSLVYFHRVPAVGLGVAFPLLMGAVCSQWAADPFALAGVRWDETYLPIVWIISSSLLRMLFATIHSGMVNGSIPSEEKEWNALRWLQTTDTIWSVLGVAIGILSVDLPIRIAACVGLGLLWTTHPVRMERDLKNTSFAILFHIQALYACLWMSGMRGWTGNLSIPSTAIPAAIAFVLLCESISIGLFDLNWTNTTRWLSQGWRNLNRCVCVLLMFVAIGLHSLGTIELVCIAMAFVIAVASEWQSAVSKQSVREVWTGLAILGLGIIWAFIQSGVAWSSGIAQLVLIGLSIALIASAYYLEPLTRYGIFAQPLRWIGLTLPALVSGVSMVDSITVMSNRWSAMNQLSWLFAAGIYFHRSYQTGNRYFAVLACIMVNASLAIHWHSMGWHDFQLYLVPMGLSVLGLTELMAKELPRETHDPLRYIGALTILVSPMFEIMQGSWLHLITLMILSVIVILLSIGFKLRALMYTGTAFLLADLVGMVVKSSFDNPTSLWICGLAVGVSVIALAAYCERRRELVLAKIRYLSAELATWR